jgi:hypothetical protein
MVLLIAERFGLEGMGLISPLLLFMTYSAFSNFGTNSNLVNKLILEPNDRRYLMGISAGYNFYASGILFVIAIAFVESIPATFVLICCFSLFRSYCQSILRAENRFRELAFYNASFGLTMLGSFFYMSYFSVNLTAGEYYQYLLAPPYILSLVLMVYFINYKVSIAPRFEKVHYHIFEPSFILMLASLVTTMLLSLDRIYVINVNSDISYGIGEVQFLDTLAAVFHLGLSSILYVMYPRLLGKARTANISFPSFRKLMCLLLLVLTTFAAIYYLLVFHVASFFISQIELVSGQLFMSILLYKLVLLTFGVYALGYISRGMEFAYLKFLGSNLLILVCVLLSHYVIEYSFDYIYLLTATFIMVNSYSNGKKMIDKAIFNV